MVGKDTEMVFLSPEKTLPNGVGLQRSHKHVEVWRAVVHAAVGKPQALSCSGSVVVRRRTPGSRSIENGILCRYTPQCKSGAAASNHIIAFVPQVHDASNRLSLSQRNRHNMPACHKLILVMTNVAITGHN